MNEENLVKAFSIGVSVFIVIIVYTSVMNYYNTAKEVSSNIISKNAIFLDSDVNEVITDILYKDVVTGNEIVSVLKYFYDSKDIIISINQCYLFNNIDNRGNYTVYYKAKNGVGALNNTNSIYTNIVNYMMPNQKFDLIKNNNEYFFKFKEG